MHILNSTVLQRGDADIVVLVQPFVTAFCHRRKAVGNGSVQFGPGTTALKHDVNEIHRR